jgi:hypothetical protein
LLEVKEVGGQFGRSAGENGQQTDSAPGHVQWDKSVFAWTAGIGIILAIGGWLAIGH